MNEKKLLDPFQSCDSPISLWRFLTFGGFALAGVLLCLLFYSGGHPVERQNIQNSILSGKPAENVLVVSGKILLASGKIISADENFSLSEEVFQSLGKGQIRLPSGVEILLSNAQFRLKHSRIALVSGKIEVVVAKKGTLFSASTPGVILGVRGTRFTVSILEDGATRVTVSEGKVEATTISGAERTLTASQSILVDKQGNINVVANQDTQKEPPADKPNANLPESGSKLGDILTE